MKFLPFKLNQIHVVVMGNTVNFFDWESAMRFLWVRSKILHSVRQVLSAGDYVASQLLDEK